MFEKYSTPPLYEMNFVAMKMEAFNNWEKRDIILAELKKIDINL